MKQGICILLSTFILITGCHTTRKEAQTNPSKNPNLVLCAPTPADLDTEPGNSGALVPLFDGLVVHTFPVTTQSEKAREYFNQGFILNYGFNHAEAARSFREAIRLDPEFAMAYWGLGYVLGPNYNAGMFPEVHAFALEAIQNAKSWMHQVTQKEQELIMALDKRYPSNIEEDPMPYYQAYADAMQVLYAKYPGDPDIAAMTAESMMDLHPWDIWEKSGEPRPWTPGILAIIEKGLDTYPNHPQLNHLYIHAMEASPNPEKAKFAADRLQDLVPGSGHLVHMPSHLYINTGDYHEGTEANARAVKIDSAYVEACHADGLYPLAYYPHNWHFLAACAGLEGRGDVALQASRYMSQYTVDDQLMRDSTLTTLQHFYSIPWFIMVKFAKWDAIMHEPRPDEDLDYPIGIWSYATGMAYAANGKITKAKERLDEIRRIGAKPAMQTMMIWDINHMSDILEIAGYVLEGEIARRSGDYQAAIRAFQKGVEIEDKLNYQEPPDWFFSVRHHLGDAYLLAKQFENAEAVYREDLKELKRNGWALHGLYLALRGQNKVKEAEEVLKQFNEAWKYADVELSSSVIG